MVAFAAGAHQTGVFQNRSSGSALAGGCCSEASHSGERKGEVMVQLKPRLLNDDMFGLKQAAIAGLGAVALPGYVCRDEVRSGALRRVLPARFLAIPRSPLSFRTDRAFSHWFRLRKSSSG